MENVEVLELLARRREHDGLAGDLADRQGGATAGVAVELGQDDAGEVDAIAERLGGDDGVLADHGVDDEEDLVGVDGVADVGGLLHQDLVDAQATGGIDDDHVVLVDAGMLDAAARDVDGITVAGAHLVLVRVDGGARVRREAGDARLLRDDLQLLHRAGALEVTGHQDGGVPLPGEVLRQLAGERGLTRALQTGEHDHRRRGLREADALRVAAEDLDELLVDDLDDLLRRVQRLRHLRAGGALLDALDEGAHHGQGDVGLQQREADLAGGGVDVRLGQAALATQILQCPGEPFGE